MDVLVGGCVDKPDRCVNFLPPLRLADLDKRRPDSI